MKGPIVTDEMAKRGQAWAFAHGFSLDVNLVREIVRASLDEGEDNVTDQEEEP